MMYNGLDENYTCKNQSINKLCISSIIFLHTQVHKCYKYLTMFPSNISSLTATKKMHNVEAVVKQIHTMDTIIL